MAKYQDVTLSDGREVRVYAPPTLRFSDQLDRKWARLHPDPQPPIEEAEGVGGQIIRMVIEDDPDYLRKKEEAERLRQEGKDRDLEEVTTLYAFKEVEVPEGWDVEREFGEFIRFADPEWQPRKGEKGRKLDYIEYDLLGNPSDAMKVSLVIARMQGIDMEAVDLIEDSFRSSMAGEGAEVVAEKSGEEAEE